MINEVTQMMGRQDVLQHRERTYRGEDSYYIQCIVRLLDNRLDNTTDLCRLRAFPRQAQEDTTRS